MTDSRYALRPEAGPVRYDSLNPSQRDALKAIVAALSQAVKDAVQSHSSREPEGADGAIETDRASRLFFVSGEPGSGKSSLYVTLRAIVGKDSRHADLRMEYREKLSLADLNGTIRWLEPLDLEVAGDEGENLLAAVLVRISEAIDHSSLSASKACRDAIDQLEELANDIGIAWDGNLKARAGRLDQDTYSQETMRAQRTRLKINSRLRRALDTLLKSECYGLSAEQLFVLPVDDFYLKPQASLELLRLLRMISVPRLFFLIMGDMKTVEALFFEQALADWTAVAGPHVFATMGDRTKHEVLPRVREMKARYLRKLIPVGQRAVINWTEWDHALAFMPPATTDTDNVPQLHQLLSNVHICWENGPGQRDHNLLNYLITPPSIRESLENHKDFLEAYSGLSILDATPREILDLWMRLRKLEEARHPCGEPSSDNNEPLGQNTPVIDKTAPRYLRMVVDCALGAIEEQDFLTEEDQEILRFTFPTSNFDDLQFDTDKLNITHEVGPWRPNLTRDILVRRHLDWRLGIRKPEPQEGTSSINQNERQHLPPRVAAWIILLHDLSWNWSSESILENLVHRLREEIGDSSTRIESTKNPGTKDPGWAWYKNMLGQWVHFPLPAVGTFRQLDRFLAIWSHTLHVSQREPTEPERAAEGWAMAAWIAQLGSEESYKKYVLSLHRPPAADDVSERDKFTKNLFADHPVLLRWATESRK